VPLAISLEQARAFRLRRSGLVEPFATPEAAASALVGVQAQILPAAGLALHLRSGGLTNRTFEHLLYERRSLVKLWGQRGTLHLYPVEEWPLIYAALGEQPTWWRRQAERTGAADQHQARVEQVAALLRAQGSIGRSDLRQAGLDLDDELLSSWGGIFADLVRLGLACHAAPLNGEGRFASREYWLPQLEWRPPEREAANLELARRYLRAYGPATAQDLAFWGGMSIQAARRWLATLADELVELAVGGQPMLALRADLATLVLPPPERDTWPFRMLGRFDPLLLGLKDKRWLVDPQHYKRVWRAAGHIEGTLLDRGRIVATWRYERAPGGLRLLVEPFGRVTRRLETGLERQARRVAAFFALPLAEIRLSPPA
jgi:uncharacterized protein YcaQ